MQSTPIDYAAFERLKLERKPVGVKFLATRPEGIDRINIRVSLCEMFKEAQETSPFYVQKEDFICVEPMILGMEDPEPCLISGMAGGTGGLFKEARACRKIYQYIPRMLKGSVNYVAFSSVDQMTFDPDVLIITANVNQARTVLRSEGYSSGEIWSCQGTPVMACAWLYIYPVLSGKMNFTVTGLSLGMEAINFSLPDGLFLISVPWNLLPSMIENLQDENMYRSFRASSREEHFDGFRNALAELRQEMPNY
jgi:uncharacterized protein (DUF169 family)